MSADDGQVYAHCFAMIPEELLDHAMSDRAIRLYLMLNRYGNGQEPSHPGRKTLAHRLRCSLPTLDAALKELTESGFLRIQPRYLGSVRTVSDYYLADRLDPGGSPSGLGGGRQVGLAGGSPSGLGGIGTRAIKTKSKSKSNTLSRTPILRPPSSPSLPGLTPDGADERDHPSYGFERFWNRYPKRNGRRGLKHKTLAIWRKMPRAEKAIAWDQVKVYARAAEGGQIPKDAERWLADGRAAKWRDYWETWEPTPVRNRQGHVDDYTNEDHAAAVASAMAQEAAYREGTWST